MFGCSLTGCSVAYRGSRVLFTKPVGLIGYRDDADALLPRVRDAAKRQHSTVPGARLRRASPVTRRSTSRRSRAPGCPRRPHEYFDPDRHANIVERLAFREMPDGAAKPNPLWHPETYDQYLAWALEEGTTRQRRVRREDHVGLPGRLRRAAARHRRHGRAATARAARTCVSRPALHPDHAREQDPPGGVAVEGRADAGVEARGRTRSSARSSSCSRFARSTTSCGC